MKPVKYITLLFLFITVNLYAQNNGTEMPTIIPKSPEVMGLERYGEYPVSEYTGVPSINIPLYTIKIKDFEFPISLDYHAAGIQVTQEATWVGLGWNLMAGGCISTIPIGVVDGAANSFALSSEWTKILNYASNSNNGKPRRFNEDGQRLWGCYANPENDNSISNTPDRILMDGLKGSGERDIYRVSLFGNSFNVSIHPVTKLFVYNGEKNKFKIEKSGWLSWTLTDEYGYVYFFSDIESYNSGGSQETSTWYLTKVEYAGQTLLKFKYTSAYVDYLPNVSDHLSVRLQSNIPIYMDMPTRHLSKYDYYKQLYVSSIVSPLDSIAFKTKTRTDLRDAQALEEILIYKRGTETEIKRYKFTYDYFSPTQSQGAVYTKQAHAVKRLKLTELQEMKGNQTKGSYQFEYNTIDLPFKTSFSQDFWGYYNGIGNVSAGTTIYGSYQTGDGALYSPTSTLLPNIGGFPGYFKGITRNSDADCIMAGMLKSITYPTGGKTEFEFEVHRFKEETGSSEITWHTATAYKSVIDNGNPSFSTPKLIFENERTVTAKVTVNINGANYNSVQAMQPFSVTFSCVGFSKTYEITAANWSEFLLNNKKLHIEENITIPVGRVTLSTSVDYNMLYQGYDINLPNGVQATISYTQNVSNNTENGISIGAGVRVKSIKSYTDNNTLAFTKRYKYTLTNGQSSGKLLVPMRFMITKNKYYAIIPPTNAGKGGGHNLNGYAVNELFSNNQYNYAANGCNAMVGYDRVEVENISSSEVTSTGKIVSEFINVPSYSQYDLIFYPLNEQYRNGKLTCKTVLSGISDTLSVEKNTYAVENFEYNLMNVHVTDNYVGPTDACETSGSNVPVPMNLYAYNGRFDIIVYPTNSYTVHLTKKEEIAYFGTNNKVRKTTDYEYYTNNYQIKKITETIDGKNYIKEYKYPLNYGDGDFYARRPMVDANMISIPIEEFTSVNTTPIQSKKTEYFLFNSNTILAPNYIWLKNGTNAYEARLKYENYNKFGNPVYITKDDATKVVYIWGYNYQYPIAEIKNFTYDQLKSIIPETDLDNIAKKMAPDTADMDRINALRNDTKLKDAYVTTFWYSPLVGRIQARDPSGKDIFFEYDTFNRLKNSYIMENGAKKIVEGYEYLIKQ
ncbi:MAG: hypothetical protein LBI82_06925 [Dysgonamonadaceae bacterium]|jgi:hypothetical protein|nr:hypothetical protein [Dysgonamonadaceae bacterium]